MKRIIILIALTVICCFLPTAYADTSYYTLGLPNAEFISTTVVEETIYGLTNDGRLVAVSGGETSFQEISTTFSPFQYGYPEGDDNTYAISVLVEIDNYLCGLNLFNGIVYKIDTRANGSISPLYFLEWENMTRIEDGYRYIKPIKEVSVYNGNLYFIHTDQQAKVPGTTYLFCFDLATGKQTKFDYENSYHFAVEDDNTLWIGVLGTEALSLYQLNPWQNTAHFVADLERTASGFVCEAGKMLFCGDGAIYSIDADGHFETLTSISATYDLECAGMLAQGRYLIPGIDFVAAYDTSQQADIRTLTIYGTPDTEANRSFSQKYTQVSIREPIEFFETSEDLVQALLTQSSNYDIFVLDTQYFDITPIFEKGYFVDLSANPKIATRIEQMYPSIVAKVKNNGKLFAAPVGISIFADTIDPQALADLFGTDRVPVHYDEFLDVLRSWRTLSVEELDQYQVVGAAAPQRWLLDTLLRNYIANYQYTQEPLNFDTPLFHELLASFRELDDVCIRKNPDYESEKTWIFYPAETDLLDTGAWAGKHMLLLSPNDIKAQPIKGSLKLYVINPFSQNVDLAMEYVAYTLEHMSPLHKITLYPSESTPVEHPQFAGHSKKLQEEQEKAQAALAHSSDTMQREAQSRLDEINAEYEEIQSWRYIVSPQDINVYQGKIAPNLFFPGPSFLDIIGSIHDQMILEIDRYLAKQYNDSQFIARIQQIVKMICAEQAS